VFVTRIIGHESFTSLSISLVQMLVERNGFDFNLLNHPFILYLHMAFDN
jgi:hypothetical protein